MTNISMHTISAAIGVQIMIFIFLRVLPGVMFDLNNNMPSEVMIASTDEAIRKLCCRSGLKKVLE